MFHVKHPFAQLSEPCTPIFSPTLLSPHPPPWVRGRHVGRMSFPAPKERMGKLFAIPRAVWYKCSDESEGRDGRWPTRRGTGGVNDR